MSSLAKTYDQVAKGYSRSNYRFFWEKEFPIFKKLIKGKKVVDLGCGAGRDAEKFVKNKFDYLGIDISSGMLAEARKRVPKAKFKVMDLHKLKLPKQSFDGFWAAASLLHISKKQVGKVLRSMRALLKDDGAGFISLKKKTHLSEGVIPQEIYGGEIKRFFAFYTKSEFEKILKQNGFKVVKFTTKVNPLDPAHAIWICFFVEKD